MTIGNSLHWSMHMPVGSHRWGISGTGYGLQKASCTFKGDWALLVQATHGQAPLLWAKGIRGLSAIWCLLHDLQVAGTDHSSRFRGQREAWLATTGGLLVGTTSDPSHLRGCQKRKKEDIATKHHTLLFSHPWEHTHPVASTAKCSG